MAGQVATLAVACRSSSAGRAPLLCKAVAVGSSPTSDSHENPASDVRAESDRLRSGRPDVDGQSRALPAPTAGRGPRRVGGVLTGPDRALPNRVVWLRLAVFVPIAFVVWR